MIDDRETERRLESWLQDEARPMPEYVLEASIEGVARTGQVSPHRPVVLRWLGGRQLATVGAIAAVLVAAVAIGPRVLERPAHTDVGGRVPVVVPTLTWDPAADFRASPDHANPSPDRHGNAGVWSYMRSASDAHDPTSYTLLPDSRVAGTSTTWYDEEFPSLEIGWVRAEAVIWLHPWSTGNRSENHHAIVRWRSPASGRFELDGRVTHRDWQCIVGRTDGTSLFVDHEGESIVSVNLDPGESEPFGVTVDVVAGESLYFVVDPGRASNCDTTGIKLTITQAGT